MTKKKPFNDSNLIDKHCLDNLSIEEDETLQSIVSQHPEALQSLQEKQYALEKYLSNSFKKESPAFNKQVILDKLQNLILADLALNNLGQLNQFIPLSPHSAPSLWQHLTRELHPPDYYKNIHAHTLFADKQTQLYLLWIKKEIPKEMHPNLDERLLILSGSCTYTIDGETKTLRSGQYKKIPPQSGHQFNVISKKSVKAILSRTKIS